MLVKGANPKLSEAELNALLSDVYGLSGRLKRLVSFDDQNARVDVDGVRYVLKISNPAEDINCLKVQNQVLSHMAVRAPNLLAPRVIKTLTGEEIHSHRVGDTTYLVRLLTYLEGEIFGLVPRSRKLYFDLGRFMGEVSVALSDFTTDITYQSNQEWNMDKIHLNREKAKAIKDADNYALIERYYAHYETEVLPKLEGMRSAMLHHDANSHNLTVSKNDNTRVEGLFDFGDLMAGRQINELAVTVGYAMLGADAPLHDASAIIEGYVSVFPITREEAAVVMELAAMRLAVSITLSSIKMQEYPDHDYIVIGQKPGYKVLKTLDGLSWADIRAVGLKAAGF